eukprot:12988628-Alexandrium_andersonii.AAC.1
MSSPRLLLAKLAAPAAQSAARSWTHAALAKRVAQERPCASPASSAARRAYARRSALCGFGAPCPAQSTPRAF